MSDFPITIFHNPDCGTSRNALAMIRAAGYPSGPSPATKVRAWGKLVLDDAFILDRLHEVCRPDMERPLQKGEIQDEFTLFPGQLASIPAWAHMDPADLADLKKRGLRTVRLTVVGCLHYAEPSGKWHHTPFAYDVAVKGGPADLNVAQTPASAVSLRQNQLGTGSPD